MRPVSEQEPAGDRFLGAADIMRRLPHRYPFLLIDRVLRTGPNEAIAVKNVTIDEPFFAGHFPGEPIMPGVLIGEAMAQAAAFIEDGTTGADGDVNRRMLLTAIDLKIERPVVPGDRLVIRATLLKRLGKLRKLSADATVDGTLVASAQISIALA
jgi:3-hydroxyacyl-[acyl-carrier-protein] dehydratase